ncbi:hypothetical protein AFCDBAGC_2086 [Methylobacterium cerastii]|uniref:Tyr recombinase domain-containing protein n=1 Tax=Methylobacterium cerastii TaxID=932741 RepID=A0ABQ4QG80_9HYPH|nr:tyrosine-type recombinase/integrase [Methylobacterium cerastii]GJD44220.1 hypothetical protein AFCDBAGC_2086 [Methylobacterium cerastii]
MPKPLPIDTAAKRGKLPARKNPYWQGVSGGRGGVSLGYRKPARGAGSWVAKLVIDGKRVEERLAPADDAKADTDAISYPAAVTASLAWAREHFARLEAAVDAEVASRAPTVRSAVVNYGMSRRARSERAGRNAEGRLAKYVLTDDAFAALHLTRLTAGAILAWRRRLPARLATSSVNRLLNDLRAALNSEADQHRRGLPAGLVGEIKSGTKATAAAPNARKQILTDVEVRRIVEAAAVVDPSGDFGHLVMVSAATGARFSQIARLTVGDVQVDRMRIMVPTSRKGRSVKATEHIAVPIGADVLANLQPILAGRNAREPLLLRWSHRRSDQPGRWERHERRAWGEAYEVEKPWAATVARAAVPADTVMLSLRHSSIVRGLRAGLPVRLVGALHDTSVQMIEQHYAAYIVDATEEIARRAVMTLAPVEPTLLQPVAA